MTDDVLRAKALARYQIISAYLALDPPRGQRTALLQRLAHKSWTGPDGAPMSPAPETLRRWVRLYRRGGLDALADAPRKDRGVTALTPEQVEIACALKAEVPARSIDRILKIMRTLGHIEPGAASRSTLHRALQRRGLSGRRARVPDTHDLDRFEAAHPNDLWQSDMLVGPWLPDPRRPGKKRRAYLYAFLDDHSRLLLHGRFSFKGDLPALELVFRRAMQKYGIPRRVYYDNGKTYRSKHMQQIVAELGMHPIVYTEKYRPMGHGKIEAFNRFVRANFLAELDASNIDTLDGLNEAFVAWVDLEYNREVHTEIGQAPRARWRIILRDDTPCTLRYAEEEALRKAFLWRERRTPDKSGVFSLFGTRYQGGPRIAKKRVELRFDPEVLDVVEVWRDDVFIERVRPLEVGPHRRPKMPSMPSPESSKAAPTADWLSHLVAERRSIFTGPAAAELAEQVRSRRQHADEAIRSLLRDRIDPAAYDSSAVDAWLDRFGPVGLDAARDAIDAIIARDGADHHSSHYLRALEPTLPGSHES